MRADQFEKLQRLEEKLIDVFIEEADPAGWPGQGLKLGAMDSQTRGDLYWTRKTAASVLVLAQKVGGLVSTAQQRAAGTLPPAGEGGEQPSGDDEGAQLDTLVDSAEREALRLMRELQGAGGKAAFDRKVHGRG